MYLRLRTFTELKTIQKGRYGLKWILGIDFNFITENRSDNDKSMSARRIDFNLY